MTNCLIEKIKEEVKRQLRDAEGGHDWSHTERVLHNALIIAQTENVDNQIIVLGALLHDIADAKFHDGDEQVGPRMASDIMSRFGIDPSIKEHVIRIIENISFKNSFDSQSWDSPELCVIRDADRLEALGAIGIARAFTYGGFKNLPIYDAEVAPTRFKSKDQYKSSNNPTINHFYEKLLLLKDKMHTSKGKELAEQRHHFLLQFLEQFYLEVGETPGWHK